MGVGVQPHVPAVSTPGKDPVPILQEAGWAPGPVWTGGKSCFHWDSTPDRPAHSQSLYRLSYPAHGSTYPYINIECPDGRDPELKKKFISEQVLGSWKYRSVSDVTVNYVI